MSFADLARDGLHATRMEYPHHVDRAVLPRKRPTDTARSYVSHVTTLGSMGSRSCRRLAVSLPRVSILEAAHA